LFEDGRRLKFENPTFFKNARKLISGVEEGDNSSE